MHPKFSGITISRMVPHHQPINLQHLRALAHALGYLRHFVLERKTALPHLHRLHTLLAPPVKKRKKKR